ncbi:MAG: J domain-containing protein, partial [Alphaproteobacteria bacterium]
GLIPLGNPNITVFSWIPHYINAKGNLAFDKNFTCAWSFSQNGLAKVSNGTGTDIEMHLIDIEGNISSRSTPYGEIHDQLSSGYATVAQGGKFGFVRAQYFRKFSRSAQSQTGKSREYYCDILNVNPYASQELIKQAYKSQMQKHHPDRWVGTQAQDWATERFKEIQAAYKHLSAYSD